MAAWFKAYPGVEVVARDRAATDMPKPPVRPSRSATRGEQRRAATRAARLAQYKEVAALNARGWSQTRIAQTLELDRKTVRVWLDFCRIAPGRRPTMRS